MPHIVVKVRTGYSKRQKVRMTNALANAVVEALECPRFDVSIGIEDVHPADWSECVYQPEILGKAATIYRQPGYALPPAASQARVSEPS